MVRCFQNSPDKKRLFGVTMISFEKPLFIHATEYNLKKVTRIEARKLAVKVLGKQQFFYKSPFKKNDSETFQLFHTNTEYLRELLGILENLNPNVVFSL